MTTEQKRILVLGVGNILFTDEGIGVRAAEELERLYEFSDNVTVMDGGTLGTRLMDPILNCDMLVVVDAVLGDGPAGSIYRLTGEDLRKSLAFKDSMHQTDLVDTLIMCEIVGTRPEAVIIGMEPHDYHTMALELSPVSKERQEALMGFVLEEIVKAGGTFAKRAVPGPLTQEREPCA
ncbi:MAG: HyaD/HybD family hydrogenase maturation endopeptidase [Humidesulfovibrio sp.]|uniref:HyaD/HybD family hydrogenase maturation endopeptidase n=1 Tax=Humidesulfovibrio sp. TaxID=2910988 RepID=UPI00273535B0|nr:HyaD/HybD family hydrogenase maturation endopeptidase [Humidesulfovibrio sp.]MDP2846593.1 HyaD/HybD family hydrogenase maturation endopeptidase [Humidesulfovibrio sp.]